MIFILLILWGMVANGSIYKEIPSKFDKNINHEKTLKFGYNLTNNFSQDQSLFFVEGVVRNDELDHSSKYQVINAKTEQEGVVSANTNSILFRTNTIVPVYIFDKIQTKIQHYKEPFAISGTLYGRFFDFQDKVKPVNNLQDTLATVGLGFSRDSIYTIGIAAGKRRADLFLGNEKFKIDETVYRSSFVYANKIEVIIPRILKKFLQQHNVYEFVASETSIKFEYAMVAAHNTSIKQLYIGFEKNISKYIAISLFLDRESTVTKHPVTGAENINAIRRISTSLIIKL